jgi:hypothetical protein
MKMIPESIQDSRRIPIEQIAQMREWTCLRWLESYTTFVMVDSCPVGIDREAGDFILGTGTGPPPKTIAVCPYCKADLNKIAVKGETVTCSICKESFIIS